MPTVQIYYPIDKTGQSYDRMRAAGVDLIDAVLPGEGPVPDYASPVTLAPDADAAAGIIRPISAEAMKAAPNLRLIANYTVGFDNVDLAAATAQGVLVVHSPNENNWGGVAEGVMAMMLAILKKVRERDRHVRQGGWMDPALLGTYVGARQIDHYAGLTIGILGFGRIGQRLADLLAPWRVRVIAHDPYGDANAFAMHDVAPVDFDTLLAESDVLTLHCNLTDETRNMIGESEFARMKPGAVLINTARGPVVDMGALVAALRAETIAAAAIDVYPEEPPGPGLSLYELGDRVLLSPHMVAGNVGSGLELAVPGVTRAVLDAVSGRVPVNVANRDAIPLWRQRFGGKSLI